MDPREKYYIPSLKNGCRVMKLLSTHVNGLDLKTICASLKIPRTTGLRICTTLEAENFLIRTPAGKYILGSGLAPLGMIALPNANIRNMAVPILNDLVKETHETAHLAVLCGKESLILEVCDSPHQLRVASRPGSLALIHCSATGKVFLAWSIHLKLCDFFNGITIERRTPKTFTTVKSLEKEIGLIRKQGYAVDDEEYFAGVRCIAAPVRNAENKVVAAIGITGATVRLTKEKIQPYAKIVQQAASRLSKVVIENQIETNDYMEMKK